MDPKVVTPTRQDFNGRRYYKCGTYYADSANVKRLHRAVWEYHNGAIPKDHHIHHKDGDVENNMLGNLECIPAAQHLSEHMTAERREWARQNMLATAIPAAAKWHKSREGRAWHSKMARESWAKKQPGTQRCLYCGETYQTHFPKRGKFCGQYCRNHARLDTEKNGQTRFCCQSCGEVWFNEPHPSRTRVCEGCRT